MGLEEIDEWLNKVIIVLEIFLFFASRVNPDLLDYCEKGKQY